MSNSPSRVLAAVAAVSVALAVVSGVSSVQASTVTVGGAPMYSTKNIIQNAVNSKDHTTLVAAVKAAGLVDTLSGPGPFTVFAPTNAAFDKLPPGTVGTLVKPENKATLTSILTYHVVPGRYDFRKLDQAIKAGGSSLRDHRQTTGELGYFQHSFQVYDREGEKCQTAGCGGVVKRFTQNGRSTFWCPKCQR